MDSLTDYVTQSSVKEYLYIFNSKSFLIFFLGRMSVLKIFHKNVIFVIIIQHNIS